MKNLVRQVVEIFFTHFVFCFFLGLITLTVLIAVLDLEHALPAEMEGKPSMAWIGMLNGILVGGITFLFHGCSRRLFPQRQSRTDGSTRRRVSALGGLVGWACGLVSVFIIFSPGGLLLLTAFIMLLVGVNLRHFARDMVVMLAPGKKATWGEVGKLIRVWLTVVASFTMLNTSLEVWHRIFDSGLLPFGFQGRGGMLLDAFYFSTVVVTTLGFGDISPHTPVAKVLVAFECLTSYVMFALTVGIVTRGVVVSGTDIDPASPPRDEDEPGAGE